MKTRSQAKAEQKKPDQAEEETKPTKSKTYCAVCFKEQFIVDGGLVCREGHGGAEPLTKDEMLERRQRFANPKPSPFKFESANAAKEDDLRPDFVKISETLFVNDIHETWMKLKAALKVGEKRSEHGVLQKALDDAESNAYKAHRLYLTAKLERDRWELENQVVFSAMWSEATASLQAEKDHGARNKQITDADIKARCATLFPDEYKAQEVKRAQAKAIVDSLENHAEQWTSRCRSLQAMLGKLR